MRNRVFNKKNVDFRGFSNVFLEPNYDLSGRWFKWTESKICALNEISGRPLMSSATVSGLLELKIELISWTRYFFLGKKTFAKNVVSRLFLGVRSSALDMFYPKLSILKFSSKFFFWWSKIFFFIDIRILDFFLKPIFEKIDDFLRNSIEILQNRPLFRTDLVENVYWNATVDVSNA